MLFFGAGHQDLVNKVLNKIRLHLRDTYHLANDNELAFCRVTNFPFYERDESTGKLDFCHNPFSMVSGGKEALENTDPLHIVSQQYDMVCNGYEILS
jgi:aspartyl-tRNA synthetase